MATDDTKARTRINALKSKNFFFLYLFILTIGVAEKASLSRSPCSKNSLATSSAT